MFTICTLCVLIVLLAFVWCKYNYSYWKRMKLPFMEPLPFIGNIKVMLTMENNFGLYLSDVYKDTKVGEAQAVGIYILNKPALIIREPELIKSILIKDFQKFSNRCAITDPHGDALGSNNLFFIRNPHWKELRTKLSPVFTSGKIKQMYPLMTDIASDLELHLSNYAKQENSFVAEVREICALFTTDLIASIAFGLRVNSLQNPDVEFRQQGRKLFQFTLSRALDFFIAFFLPKLVTLFHVKIFSREFSQFLRHTIGYVMSERERSGNKRNDLIDVLVALKKESLTSDNAGHMGSNNDFLVAQAAVFLTAGFETSSATMSFSLYELAKQPDLQQRLRLEINEALRAEHGQLSYEKICSLPYLSMVVDEVLRLYPVLPFLDREYMAPDSNSKYTLEPYFDYTLPNGMAVYIPIYGLQRDPKYWSNPDTFDPERFNAENKKEINPMTYMPFGAGQHNCIGSFIGLLQSKLGLVHFLKNHKVSICENTIKEIVFDPKALILQCQGGVHLKITYDGLYDNAPDE